MKKSNRKYFPIALFAFFAPSLAFAAGVADSVDALTYTGSDVYTLKEGDAGNFVINKYLSSTSGNGTTYTKTDLELDVANVAGTTSIAIVDENGDTVATVSISKIGEISTITAVDSAGDNLEVSSTGDNSYSIGSIATLSTSVSSATTTYTTTYSYGEDSVLNASSSLTTYYYTWSTSDTTKGDKLTSSTTYSEDADFSVTGTSTNISITGATSSSSNFLNTTASAITYSSGTTGSIDGVFVNNAAKASTSGYASGGAIMLNGTAASTITSITGDFIGNYAQGSAAGQGGAIFVHTASGNKVVTVGSITGNFIANYAYGSGTGAGNGGAINNGSKAVINSIKASFIGNYAYTNSSGTARGGAIYNQGTITSITGDFTGNYAATGTTGEALGGAINNTGTISSIECDFIDNYASSGTTGLAYGGAVYNNAGTITFKASDTDGVGSSHYYLGNWAGVGSVASDANGGFLYQTSGTSNFTIGTNSSIVIGDGTAGYDSIAGEGSIVVSGGGDLVVNSSMEYYTGSLTVSAGDMEVNNTLSASTITVASGASLAVDVLNVYLSDATSSLTLSVDGTFTLDALAVYLDETFIANVGSYINTEINLIGTTNIDEFSAYYYDSETESYLELSDEAYTFENGVFTLTAAVPEPSTYAMIIGVLALGFAYYRRRK